MDINDFILSEKDLDNQIEILGRKLSNLNQFNNNHNENSLDDFHEEENFMRQMAN